MQVTTDLQKIAKLRLLKMHFDAGVGHIGGNLSALDILLLLYLERLNMECDEFVLSKGHSVGALYVALSLKGILSDKDLETFHQDATHLPGHPPANGIPAITFATGSLGHGLSLAAGTALAKKLQHKKGHVYCLTSEGDWQEGSTWEALIFTAHHQLSNLTILLDQNQLQGFGSAKGVASMHDFSKKVAGFAIEIYQVDGHNIAEMRSALNQPQNLPRLIILNTVKGNGVSFMAGIMDWHYLPLSEVQYKQAVNEVANCEK